MKTIGKFFFILCLIPTLFAEVIELNGSAFATEAAPLPHKLKNQNEKLILVDPQNHAWGAYNARGRLIRWGIATAGAPFCAETNRSCKTKVGTFRIYLLGSENCISYKFPVADGGGAPMPFCMYFNGSEAIHGSNEVVYGNKSHGCVRIHFDDAKWLRYHFAEAPSPKNAYHGTKVIIRPY